MLDMRWTVVGLGLAVASPAAAEDRFDLICSSGKTEMRYRVDLARGEWCAKDCSYIQKIAEVTPSKLTLAKHDPGFATDSRYYTIIDRTNGEWLWFMSGGQDIDGHCEPASFSGMPPPKF